MGVIPKLIQRRSVQQEKKLAVQLGGKRVAGSGNMPGNKGDVKDEAWLLECKMTAKPRFSLTLGLWRKIEAEAIRAHKHPAMVIELAGRSLVVISLNDFKAFRGDV